MTDTITEGERREAEHQRYLADAGPLPTVDELAEPFVRGFIQLHDLQDRAESLRYFVGRYDVLRVKNPYEAEAHELLRLVEDVAAIVRVAAGGCLGDEHRGYEHALDRLVRAAAGVTALQTEVYSEHAWRLQSGTEEAGE